MKNGTRPELEDNDKQKPNIVLICVDQWRGDCLGIDGHPVVDTPYLDRMALTGTRCANAYTATPSCTPARAALFTGLSQESHGRVGYQDRVPWNYDTTIAGEFTKHGYQTQAIGKMHVFPERSQLGFQNVILHDGFLHNSRSYHENFDMVDDYDPWLRQQLGRETDYFENGINCNSLMARPWDKPEHTHPTNFVVTQAIDFMKKRDPRKPFFLYLSFHRPHAPFDPPGWALDQYLQQAMPEVPVGDWTALWDEFKNENHPETMFGPVQPERLRRAKAGYYGNITHIDHQLNRLFELMQDFGQRHNTWFCFVSDHGEMMGDHNLFRKTFPYQGSVRIPFILKGPRGNTLPQNAVIKEPVELRDVMPTLLECAGLPIPDGLDGQSILPLLKDDAPKWREFIHGEHTGYKEANHWLCDGKEKYIWYTSTGEEQFFNLTDDPDELHDRINDEKEAERVELWRQRMIETLKDRQEGFSDGTQLIVGRKVTPSLNFLPPQVP